MRIKYRMLPTFVKTEQEAINLVKKCNAMVSAFIRKHHPAHYTPWTDLENNIRMFVVWAYEKN